jgi:Cu2+-exporting ATPase
VISNAEKTSRKSLFDAFGKQPAKVWVLVGDQELEVLLADVKPGDILVVNTGEMVPVDGIVVGGIASIDQHMLTGESQPAEKAAGNPVFASTQVMSGRLQVKVTTSGDDTTAAKITEILNNSIDFKTNSQLRGEQWADSWNLPVLGLAFASMPLLGPVGTVAILNGHIAQTIRVVAPLSTLNHLSIASHKGILVKDGRVLEDLPNIDTFLFDKTGTLTSEEPEVGRVLIYQDQFSEEEILAYAAAAEGRLSHPIARAVVKQAEQEGVEIPRVDDTDYTIGYGVSVRIDGKLVQLGSHRFMKQEGIALPDDFSEQLQAIHEEGHSLVMLAIDHRLAGILEMHAAVRPEVPGLLAALRKRGVKHLAIVSGDHSQPTRTLAHQLGMDDCFYDVLPQHKADIVERLQAQGRTVCFVGDGVNDTIAMKKANVSISLSGATSVATDTAQIVLMDASLNKLPELLDIAIALNRNLEKAWWLNVVPGVVTMTSAFALRIDIIVALLISQTGLAAGVVNAMLPLRQARQEAQRVEIAQRKKLHSR